MNEAIDKSYRSWIAELKNRYRMVQIRAAISVNTAMLEFYWTLGKDISEQYSATEIYGAQFFVRLSADLRSAIPNATGFSPQNLRYCQHFYELYSGVANFPQLVGDFPAIGVSDIIGDLFTIPWGHHRFIIDKCGKDAQKALFYVRKTIENGWSRNTLLNWLSTDLYAREGRAQTNFGNTLPSPDSDLAQQLVKDPYIFDMKSKIRCSATPAHPSSDIALQCALRSGGVSRDGGGGVATAGGAVGDKEGLVANCDRFWRRRHNESLKPKGDRR